MVTYAASDKKKALRDFELSPTVEGRLVIYLGLADLPCRSIALSFCFRISDHHLAAHQLWPDNQDRDEGKDKKL